MSVHNELLFINNIYTYLLQHLQKFLLDLLPDPSNPNGDKSSPMKQGSSGNIDMSPFNEMTSEFTKLLRTIRVPHVIQVIEAKSYYSLKERVAAAESCWFAAKV